MLQHLNLDKLGAVLGDDIAERKMIFELFFDPISSADVGFYLIRFSIL